MSAPYVCDACGESFGNEQDRKIHPCPEVVGKKKSRAIHALADPAQRFLDEKY